MGPGGESWQEELARGTARLRDGDAEAARAAFARAHALAPDEPEPALALGREEWKRGRVGEAERLLRLAHAARPGWALGTAALARVLLERGGLEEAGQLLDEGLRLYPHHPALLVVQGERLLDAERPTDAEAFFLQARAAGADPEVIDAALARVENARGVALSSDSPTEAAFAFKRASDLAPDWAPPRANLGALLQQLGRTRRARAQYRRALALDPHHGVAWFNLGLLCRDAGDLDGAARAFAEALACDPPHPHARRELALAAADQGNYPRAIELFEEELRVIGRPDATIYANLGLACARAGQEERAEAALKQALVVDAGHAAALTNLAALYAAQGRYVDAAALLERAQRAGGNLPPGAASK
jgi:tetratricopeptide (TPR) repeat protein